MLTLLTIMMLRKHKFYFNIFYFIVVVFITLLFLYLNYRSFNNIDDRANYSSFYDTCWFYHPIINFINNRGWTSEGFLYYKNTDHLFGTHSFFFLYFYAIILYFVQTPLVLFLSTPLFYAFASFYLFKIIKFSNFTLNKSILIACMFFLNPQFYWSLWHGFYLVNIGSFLLIPFFYYIITNKLFFSLLFGLLVSICQEFMAIIVSLTFLVYVFYVNTNKLKKYFIIFSIFFMLYFIFNFFYLIPSYSNFAPNHEIEVFYGYLGSTFPEITKNFFIRFTDVVDVLLIREKIIYIFLLTGPYFFLSFLSPLIFSAFPLLAIHLFSVFPPFYDIRISYSTPINAVLFLSAVSFFINHKKLKIFNNKFLLFFLIIFLFFNYYKFSPSIFSRQFKSVSNCSILTDRKFQVKNLINKYNEYNRYNEYRISVTDIYSIYFADYYHVLTPFPHFYNEVDILFIDTKFFRNNNEKNIIYELIDSGNYNLNKYNILEKPVYVLIRKNTQIQ